MDYGLIITANSFGLLISFLVLYGVTFETKDRNAKVKRFTICSLICFLATLFDLLSYVLEGVFVYDYLMYFINFVAVTAGGVLVSAYGFYFRDAVSEKAQISKWHPICIASINVASMIFLVVGIFLGKTFTFVDHVFTTGPWYMAAPIVAGGSMVYLIILTLMYYKKIGGHDCAAFVIYCILPVICVILSVVTDLPNFSYAACSVSLTLLFIMFQSKQVSELHSREELLSEASVTDTLTSLLNRRAYDEVLDNIDSTKFVGVLFADVNGLKYMNDTAGHKAGDARLVKFTKLLQKHFKSNTIYRISGDEFVVIDVDCLEDFFYQCVRDLDRDIALNNEIASVGAVYGPGEDVLKLINEAERRMYDDKQTYHSKYKEQTR